MKNQYFGDINDYRKYGILRCLANVGRLRIGVCWMLTPSDGSADGQQTQYLSSPGEWRSLDPDLFDALRDALDRTQREVTVVEASGLLPGAAYFSREVPIGRTARVGHLSACLDLFAQTDVVFFDPDNGLEVPSVSYGARASPKYLFWREVIATYHEGHSLLVYQETGAGQENAAPCGGLQPGELLKALPVGLPGQAQKYQGEPERGQAQGPDERAGG